ncbi:hypothetical protein QFZ23_000952 [Arthrobacter globiformis]|uniref:hypothetical protein n=1 Tax=Arthrobacter globiformis TaxID=1665 RepID=UPI0027850A8B|nr:hypothetical protein [Arthrobacter globiformis]MDQ1057051.1 hypothetical protein [Arthrobacter globiformis]
MTITDQTALQTDAANYTWAAAVVGSNNAAGYQLAAELPVMAVGGFNGKPTSRPKPSAAPRCTTCPDGPRPFDPQAV